MKLPTSIPSEAAVLGSMIIDPNCVNDVAEILTVDSFFDCNHRVVFKAIIDIHTDNIDGALVDGVIIRERLNKQGKIKGDSVTILSRLAEAVPSSANAIHYAKIVKQRQLERDLISSTEGAIKVINDSTIDFEDKREAIEQLALEVDQDKNGEAVHIKDIAVDAFSKQLDKSDGKFLEDGIKTGFYELDDLTGGLFEGDIVIIAARPGLGKTSIAMNMASYMADRKNIAFFSMEMTGLSLAQRLMSTESKVPLYRMRTGRLSSDDLAEIGLSADRLKKKNLWVDSTATLTPATLTTKILRMKKRYNIDCAFVDYLQLMHLGKKIESRQQEITAITRQLKALAIRANIPIVILSQLSRACEQRTNHRPKLSDLRESGAIEQDASVVLLLHRDDYYRKQSDNKSEDDGKAVCIVAKNRQGACGDVNLVWISEFFYFSN